MRVTSASLAPRFGLISLLLAGISAASVAQALPDRDTSRLIEAGKEHNNLYGQLTYLTKHIGPRVTGSPQLMRADEWAVRMLKNYGFTNVHLEQWDTVPCGFWRGPNSSARMISPVAAQMVFSTNNWTAGTHGPVQGSAINEPKSIEEVNALGSKLKNAWIMMPTKVFMRGPVMVNPTMVDAVLDKAGIAGRVYSTGSDLVWSHGNYRGIDPKKLPTQVLISLRGSDFDAAEAAMAKGQDVRLEFNVDNRFTGKPQPVYNVVADYPGTDLKDQIVLIGGHFDSWNSPGSEGAADNGTGSMIAVEAARLIKATGVAHRRTVRVVLYGGEEEGLLGSRGYVEAHKAELGSIVAVLNDDGGSNAETGFQSVKGTEDLLAPLPALVNGAFPEMPIQITFGDRWPTGASDHTSFVDGGIPAVDWGKAGQPVSYRYIWHTQNDTLENTYKPGLIQSSTCSALTMYLLLNSDATLPRAVKPPVVAPTR